MVEKLNYSYFITRKDNLIQYTIEVNYLSNTLVPILNNHLQLMVHANTCFLPISEKGYKTRVTSMFYKKCGVPKPCMSKSPNFSIRAFSIFVLLNKKLVKLNIPSPLPDLKSQI